MILNFGAGDAFAIPLYDAFGTPIAVPTPCRVQGLQELSVEVSGDTKEFHGQGRFALAVAQGKTKINGKLKGAFLDGHSLNTLYFGTGYSSGTMTAIMPDVTGTVIPSSPSTIKPTVPASGTFLQDEGVTVNGVAYIRVASAPTAGQYAVSADGTYTFATADAGKTAYISFKYSYTAANAKQITLNNLPMGMAPRFRLEYVTTYNGKRAYLELASVIAPKLSLIGSKNDDFSIPDLDFAAQADDSGYYIGKLLLSE